MKTDITKILIVGLVIGALLLVIAFYPAQATYVGGSGIGVVPNTFSMPYTSAPTLNGLVIQSAGVAAAAGTGNTIGVIGIASLNETVNKQTLITYMGASKCTFDANGVTVDHAFGTSTTTATDCLDLGTLATACAGTVQILGQITNATTAGAGLYTVNMTEHLCAK